MADAVSDEARAEPSTPAAEPAPFFRQGRPEVVPHGRRFGLALVPSASTRTLTSSLRPLMKSTTRTTS